nr:unnamed protein product [Callosobruchus chinensis]CAH7764309.1 unnamed protein product [Callosobruchus chinensis]
MVQKMVYRKKPLFKCKFIKRAKST